MLAAAVLFVAQGLVAKDRKSTRLNSSHQIISYAVFCLKKKTPTHSAPHRASRGLHSTIITGSRLVPGHDSFASSPCSAPPDRVLPFDAPRTRRPESPVA